MPYFVNTDPGVLAGRGEIQPSARLSFAGAVGSAITGNASSVIADYAELQQANQGPRLTREAANQAFVDAGIKHTAPAGGYTQSAVDILIKRQRNQSLLREIDAATPYSWVGTPVRGGAMLLAGLADPLNVASAFVPVVREARVASMLARAGESGLARAGARAAIGAAEGFAGAAALEVPTYGLRTAMQDDYSLTDSLVNMAFGTALGGGMHAVGGAIGDHLGGGNPYARFAGLGTKEVRQVLDFEAGRLDASGFTPAQRRAAGLAQSDETVPVAAVEQRVLQPAERQPLAAIADAPFARLYEMTPERAAATAGEKLRDAFRAELLAEAGQRAEPRVIAETKAQLFDLQQQLKTLQSEPEFKRRAKEFQGQGLSRKEAEAAARKQIGDELTDANATQQRLEATVDSNAKAAQAEQQLAALDRGEVPERFADRVKTEADSITGAADIARAINGTSEPPAAFVIGMAQPETREAAMRVALADFAAGRMPAVEALVRSDPGLIGNRTTPQQVAQSARAQREPDAAALGSREASEAATVKQRDGTTEIEKELAADVQRLDDLVRNLEANGIPREALDRIANLSAFDDEVKRAAAIGEVSRIAAICGIRT
jgi:hypothetical protein